MNRVLVYLAAFLGFVLGVAVQETYHYLNDDCQMEVVQQ